MKFYKMSPAAFMIDPLLMIDNDTFVELVDVRSNFMVYNLRWRISLQYPDKNPQEYEKIVIKVKKDTSYLDLEGSSSTSNFSKGNLKDVKNPTSIAKKQLQSSSTIKTSAKTANKLNLGVKMLQDFFMKDETIIVEKEVGIPPSIPASGKQSSINSAPQFSFIEAYEPEIRPSRIPVPPPLSEIDARSVIERVNVEHEVPSYVGTANINSQVNLYDAKLIQDRLKNFPKIKLDYLRYFLYEVPKSNFEDGSTWYSTRESVGGLRHYQMSTEILLPAELSNSKFEVVFELYKKGTSKVQEIHTKKFNSGEHYEAKRSIQLPPIVVAKFNKPKRGPAFNLFSFLNTCTLSISQQGGEGIKNTIGYKIYSTPITRLGSVETTDLLGTIPINKSEFTFILNSKLAVIRVVPIGLGGEESNVFTDIVVGSEYEDFGNLTITPHRVPNQRFIKIDVHNISKKCNELLLYRRDCTNNPDAHFEMKKSVSITAGVKNFSIYDPIDTDKIFEYYVAANVKNTESAVDTLQKSNYVFLKHPSNIEFKNQILVEISPVQASITSNSTSYSFEITTTVSQEENEKITEFVKTLAPELYDYFLNPANIAQSGIPKTDYADIVVHEVIRTNINTSERESLGMVTDGAFEDNQTISKRANAKPINPQHDYLYQIFSYKRNPITLFKDYVAYGNENGREWFFSPYKWHNPTVVATGKLYPQDNKFIPIIDVYESLTAESYGMTAQALVKGAGDASKISQVIAKRLDVNTVKISWSSNAATASSFSRLYDSFVVMKVVNGIRYFAGRTHKNFIYHELTASEDIGSVYYIVVPIIRGYDIDEPAYSNEIYIGPEGLTPVTPVQPPAQSPPPPQEQQSQQDPNDIDMIPK